jgi:hypothetical protein
MSTEDVPPAFPIRRTQWGEIPDQRDTAILVVWTTDGLPHPFVVTPTQLRLLAADFLQTANKLDPGGEPAGY